MRQMVDMNKQMEDKEFVKQYFKDCEDGNAVTKKLIQDAATLNSPDLIARLVGWLNDAEDTSEDSSAADAKSTIANLPSSQTSSTETGNSTSTSGSSSENSEQSTTSSPASTTGGGLFNNK